MKGEQDRLHCSGSLKGSSQVVLTQNNEEKPRASNMTIVPVLTKAIQELSNENKKPHELLEARIKALGDERSQISEVGPSFLIVLNPMSRSAVFSCFAFSRCGSPRPSWQKPSKCFRRVR